MTEDNNKHSKMTLMSFQEAVAYASTPQAEGRIGHEDRVKDIFKDMLKENRDRRVGEGSTPSVFLNREEI